ncbi:hypothetical protein KO481_31195 [Nocardia sp. NEAU-G5]|uniref:Uncharacterized protein n=1 Tax=Nocardia albiluteola TaxID=2842303 RepID=A0ABS6B6N7_9NOCA|nr:hypothetical protein [Nocardia albiluteola]MBU3065975.1 hypothetical protein [Nocardia albiluteola]
MPSISHEAPLELLRHNPYLAAVLLAGTGVDIPADAVATPADGDLTACEPTELRADAMVILHNEHRKLAVIVESQTAPPNRKKRRAMAAYVALAQSEHDCDAVLIVVTSSRKTAHACSKIIHTGHPGYNLRPFVIGPDTTPDPADPANALANVELTVLAALNHALDLHNETTLRTVGHTLATLDADQRETYTRFINLTASPEAQAALEEFMKITWPHDPFIDGLKDEGRAEGLAKGEARILLQFLAARGIAITTDIRDRIESCADTDQLETWAVRAATSNSIDEVFTD